MACEYVPRATPRRWGGGGAAVGVVCGDDDDCAEKREGECRRVWRRVVVGASDQVGAPF